MIIILMEMVVFWVMMERGSEFRVMEKKTWNTMTKDVSDLGSID